MLRVNTPEILDSDACPPVEVEASLRDHVPHQPLVRRSRHHASPDRARRHPSPEANISRSWKWPRDSARCSKIAGRQLQRQGITLDVTDLDRAHTHLLRGNRAVVADALSLPFRDRSFDLVSCSLFAHHLEPAELARFAHEALRVSRCAVLINDLVRHPLHVALVYAGFPLMRSYVSRFDGLASVRRAYIPDEMRQILSSAAEPAARVEISRHFLFRMGAIAWKTGNC